MKTLCAYCYAFLLALVLTRCGPAGNPVDSQRVVVYTSVDRIFSEPVLQRAAQILDVDVIGVYDTEETKSTGLVNRLIAKKENPDGDLFWSGDPARAALLLERASAELGGLIDLLEGRRAHPVSGV